MKLFDAQENFFNLNFFFLTGRNLKRRLKSKDEIVVNGLRPRVNDIDLVKEFNCFEFWGF